MEQDDWCSSGEGLSDSEPCFEDKYDGDEDVFDLTGSVRKLQMRFLAEVGALSILDEEDVAIPLKDIYEKVAQGQSGCNWEAFQVYRHLKSLGYIVGRHGVPWSLKSIKNKVDSPSRSLEDDKVVEDACKEEQSIVDLLSELLIIEGKIIFDVYPPNSEFRKSSPGDPLFAITLAGSRPPSTDEIEGLERQCEGCPLRFAQLEHGRVTFFTFDKVELAVLP